MLNFPSMKKLKDNENLNDDFGSWSHAGDNCGIVTTLTINDR